GPTDLANLALACPHCNGRKWAHTEAVDPESKRIVPLFNPRTQVWSDHFQWSQQSPVVLEGKTEIGRATIAALEMNHQNVQQVRGLLLRLGIRLEPGDAGGLKWEEWRVRKKKWANVGIQISPPFFWVCSIAGRHAFAALEERRFRPVCPGPRKHE